MSGESLGFDFVFRGAITVTDELVPFKEVAVSQISIEFFIRDEIILAAISFAWAHRSGGEGHGIIEVDSRVL